MKKLLLVVALLSMGATACPAPTAAVDWSVCPAAAAGQVQVAVVVQGGTATPATEVVCVVVPAGSNGLDALAARAARIGAAAPRVESAFVCGIDGIPVAPACADSGPGGYTYWNYWTGGTAWATAAIGAGDRIVTQGSVDAWTYGTWDFVSTFPADPTKPATFAALTK